MKSLKNKILNDASPLSQADLQNYLAGNLTEKEMHHIEQIILSSELNAATVEGFQEFPDALKRIEKHKSKFKGESSITKKNWWQNNVFTIGLFTALIIISAVGINVHLREKTGKSDALAVETINESHAAILETGELKEIESSIPIAEEELISYSKTVEDQKKESAIEDRLNGATENTVPQKIDLSLANKIPLDEKKIIKNDGHQPAVTIEKPNTPTLYIFDLKVVDYSLVYKSAIPLNRNLSGLEAKYEKEQDLLESNISDWRQKNVPYEEFLGAALNKFAKSDYKNALIDFIIILKNFPGDVNAHFYGGLCYYNIGKPAKAIGYFDHLLSGQINTFSQEAKWYKALSLEQKGDKLSLEILLQEIIDQDGFYAGRAKKKLGQ